MKAPYATWNKGTYRPKFNRASLVINDQGEELFSELDGGVLNVWHRHLYGEALIQEFNLMNEQGRTNAFKFVRELHALALMTSSIINDAVKTDSENVDNGN